MTDHLDVDLVMLDAIADRLDQAGAGVDSAGRFAPPQPDAGLATPMIADVLARLCAGAAQFAADMRAVSDRLAEAGRLYAEEDVAAGQSIYGAN
ncbi:hypothetical protein [Actinoplanes subglobosus]|uniref:ESX-1 secretion-associated protein n=1 Tax=Actinoplanes subglobosus TaxID=1547892 RepID=A0ABV8IZE9_9ACTN